jgi:hypothetical protein
MRSFTLLLAMILGVYTTHGSREIYREDGCIKTTYLGWSVKAASKLGCGTSSTGRIEASEREIELPPKVDLSSPNWTVKSQFNLGTCAIFSMVAAMEFLTEERFSEAELTVRMASGRCIDGDIFNSIDKGFALVEFLPFIRAGLIPEDTSVNYDRYNAYASQRPENERLAVSADYRTSIEHMKVNCCDGGDSDRLLPKWIDEDEILFAEDIHFIKIARPVGFWRNTTPLKFNVFRVNPCDLNRLKYILNFVPVIIGMDCVYPCDSNTHMIDSETSSWWKHIQNKHGDAAIIQLFTDHQRKLEIGEIAISKSHAVCLCGYDDKLQAFKFRNSWGTGYANDGYGYIHYEVFRLNFLRCYKTDNRQEQAATPQQASSEEGHVYEARVVVSHPSTELEPDVLETIEEKDHSVLNKMLVEFKQRRAQGKL